MTGLAPPAGLPPVPGAPGGPLKGCESPARGHPRRRPARWRTRLGTAALLLLGLPAALAGGLTPQERAGRALYRDGLGADGRPVQALVGFPGTRLQGAAVACANCHGRDGLGRPEAGLAPPPLLWSELARPDGHAHADGRRHPAFTPASLGRALVQGLDPAGHRLDAAMPRFLLSAADLAHLGAYLKRLGDERDPGIDAGRLRIGALLPSRGAGAAAGGLLRRLLQAGFDEINRAGGLHGRRLELVAIEPPADAAALAALPEPDVLALLAPLGLGAHGELAAWAQARQLPLIAPFPPEAAQHDAADRPSIFHVLGGASEQARLLAAFAAREPAWTQQGALLLHPAGPAAALAQALEDECRRQGCGRIERVEYAAGDRDAAARAGTGRPDAPGLVFHLGADDEVAAFAQAAARQAWHPRLLLPGAFAARAAARLPQGFDGQVFLAYPGLPPDALAGAAGFAAFRQRHGLGEAHLGAQAAAHAGVQLLVEGLRRSGRALSREKLVAALEGVRALPTGVTPPLSYGPRRRIGSPGGHVVMLARDGAGRVFRAAGAPLEPE